MPWFLPPPKTSSLNWETCFYLHCLFNQTGKGRYPNGNQHITDNRMHVDIPLNPMTVFSRFPEVTRIQIDDRQKEIKTVPKSLPIGRVWRLRRVRLVFRCHTVAKQKDADDDKSRAPSGSPPGLPPESDGYVQKPT